MLGPGDRIVEHEKVVADIVEAVCIPPVMQSGGKRLRAQFLVENAEADFLRGLDLAGVARQPDGQ